MSPTRMMILIGASVAALVLVATGSVLVGMRLTTGGKQQAAPPQAPTTTPAATPSSLPSAASPTPVGASTEAPEDVYGVPLLRTDEAGPDATEQAVAVLTYLSARYNIDASKPWPGLDVEAVKASVSGPMAERTKYEVRDWEDPSDSMLEGYEEDRTWKQKLTVNSLIATDDGGDPVIIAEYELKSPTDAKRETLAYVVKKGLDGRWTCYEERKPQAL